MVGDHQLIAAGEARMRTKKHHADKAGHWPGQGQRLVMPARRQRQVGRGKWAEPARLGSSQSQSNTPRRSGGMAGDCCHRWSGRCSSVHVNMAWNTVVVAGGRRPRHVIHPSEESESWLRRLGFVLGKFLSDPHSELLYGFPKRKIVFPNLCRNG